MKPEIDDLEEMLETIEHHAKTSGGWFLPAHSNSIIKTANGHLSVIHTRSLVDWSKILRKTIKLMKAESRPTELAKDYKNNR